MISDPEIGLRCRRAYRLGYSVDDIAEHMDIDINIVVFEINTWLAKAQDQRDEQNYRRSLRVNRRRIARKLRRISKWNQRDVTADWYPRTVTGNTITFVYR